MKLCSMLLAGLMITAGVMGTTTEKETAFSLKQYQDYETRFAAIENMADIGENGFCVIENQVFPVLLESF